MGSAIRVVRFAATGLRKMISAERRPVVIGEHRPSAFNPVMTEAQALRFADKMMPNDLRRAGFKASIFASTMEVHGGLWFRVNYGKTIPRA